MSQEPALTLPPTFSTSPSSAPAPATSTASISEEPEPDKKSPSYSPEFKVPERKTHPKIVATQLAITMTLERLRILQLTTSDEEFPYSRLLVESNLDELLLAVVQDDWNHNAINANVALPYSRSTWQRLRFDAKDENGVNALLLAVFLKRYSMVATILGTSSGRYALDSLGDTIMLSLATLAGDVRILELLLAKKYNVRHLILSGLSEKETINPLLIAAEKGDAKLVGCMISYFGGSLLKEMHAAGGLPLLQAVVSNNLEVVNLLLTGFSSHYQACESLALRAEGNATPLIAAVCCGHLEIVKCILAAAVVHCNETNPKKGDFLSHLMAQDFNGLNILCLAAYHKQLEVGVELMMYGAHLRQAKVSATHLEHHEEINIFLAEIEQAYHAHRELIAKQTIVAIQSELLQGQTATLHEQLEVPATVAAATAFWLRSYFKKHALFDILRARTKFAETAEWGRGRLLQGGAEALLKAYPTAISQQQDGMTAVDLAQQIRPFAVELIKILQKYENQQFAFIGDNKRFKGSSSERLVRASNSLDRRLRREEEIATSTIALEVVEQRFKVKLTQVMVKALAIENGVLDGRNKDRTKALVSALFGLFGILVPLPGSTAVVTLVGQGIVAVGEFLLKQVAQGYVKERDKKLYGQRLGGISDGGLEEAAERVKKLAEALTRRFQFIAVLLDPDSLSTFVTEIIRCMVEYWDDAMKKLTDDEKPALYHVRWNILEEPVPKYKVGDKTSAEELEIFIDNMIGGITYYKKSDPSLLAPMTAGEGIIANKLVTLTKDRLVLMRDGSKLMVGEIRQSKDAIVYVVTPQSAAYYYSRQSESSEPLESKGAPHVTSATPLLLCISAAEAQARGFIMGKEYRKMVRLGPPSLTKDRINEELEQQLAALKDKFSAIEKLSDISDEKSHELSQLIRQIHSIASSVSTPAPAPSEKVAHNLGQLGYFHAGTRGIKHPPALEPTSSPAPAPT